MDNITLQFGNVQIKPSNTQELNEVMNLWQGQLPPPTAKILWRNGRVVYGTGFENQRV